MFQSQILKKVLRLRSPLQKGEFTIQLLILVMEVIQWMNQQAVMMTCYVSQTYNLEDLF